MPPVFAPLNGSSPQASPAQLLVDALGRTIPPRDDVAFQPPTDPLKGIKEVELRARASVIHRDIPIPTISTSWTVNDVRGAIGDLAIGLFDTPSQLVDAVTGDSRVQAGLASRNGGLLGREVDFQVPRRYRDSAAAQECLDAFRDAWPTMGAEPILAEIQTWANMLGFGPAQLLWDLSGEYAIPHPRPWHPRYVYYHWLFRCYVAVTLDGQTPILPGNGQWILHAPHGEYRGWMRAAVRAIAPWWLARNFALRDWARYSERHGMPIIKAITPAAGDPVEIQRFRSDLSSLGQETCVQLPQGNDKQFSYDVQLLEASDSAWQGFAELIGACDREITLALLAQNLTTEVKEGSYAAARVHADVRQALLEADARSLSDTIYRQLSRPFAAMNFGDPDLAPRVIWSVQPYEDNLTAVQTLLQFAQAIYTLRNSGKQVADVERLARDFGIRLGQLEDVTPLQEATRAAGAAQDKQAARAGGRKRFEALASEHLRLRIASGSSEEEIAHENEAIAEMLRETRVAKRKARV